MNVAFPPVASVMGVVATDVGLEVVEKCHGQQLSLNDIDVLGFSTKTKQYFVDTEICEHKRSESFWDRPRLLNCSHQISRYASGFDE